MIIFKFNLSVTWEEFIFLEIILLFSIYVEGKLLSTSYSVIGEKLIGHSFQLPRYEVVFLFWFFPC